MADRYGDEVAKFRAAARDLLAALPIHVTDLFAAETNMAALTQPNLSDLAQFSPLRSLPDTGVEQSDGGNPSAPRSRQNGDALNFPPRPMPAPPRPDGTNSSRRPAPSTGAAHTAESEPPVYSLRRPRKGTNNGSQNGHSAGADQGQGQRPPLATLPNAAPDDGTMPTFPSTAAETWRALAALTEDVTSTAIPSVGDLTPMGLPPGGQPAPDLLVNALRAIDVLATALSSPPVANAVTAQDVPPSPDAAAPEPSAATPDMAAYPSASPLATPNGRGYPHPDLPALGRPPSLVDGLDPLTNPDPLRTLDAQLLTALINEVLVEQARRYGVDLS
jgi:hypothetical protein